MFYHYLKTAWRNLAKNKANSFINITGLSVGMAVSMLIGLWIYDELSFNKNNTHYHQIVEVMANAHIGDGIQTSTSLPLPVTAELRNKYGNDLLKVAAAISLGQHIVYKEKAFSQSGIFAEAGLTDILTLPMLEGTAGSLAEKNSILLSASFAKAVFGNDDPINKTIKLNNNRLQTVTGVYQDFPRNSQFNSQEFIAPVSALFDNDEPFHNWYNSSFQVFALLNPYADRQKITANIKDIVYKNSQDASHPSLILFPMSQWHLYDFDKNGRPVASGMQIVWMFGIIGAFVLLLACINFMNLSTAQSEKRAKEVGIRKTIGSVKRQLVLQFFGESLLMVTAAFIAALIMVELAVPAFNAIAAKDIRLPLTNPFFWITNILFVIVTAVIAGSYPALFLSSFKPVKVLKGTFKAGRLASIPRKVLVVVQFTVSIVLIISTIVVFDQIQFAKDRPVGYNRSSLITLPYNATEIPGYTAFKNEILNTGYASGISLSGNPITGIWSSADNLGWEGKDPNRQESFGTILIDPQYGDVVEWKIKEGRNFSDKIRTDSMAFIFNEAAIKQMNLADPIGKNISWHGKNWAVIGVAKDMVMQSPFQPAVPTVFLMNDKERSFNAITIKIKAGVPASTAIASIEKIFKKFAPDTPFDYKFVDDQYANKFAEEMRVGKLSSIFASLAIFISCLGLFGMASFMAEQRTKEIGVRKVLGASVFNLWRLLSTEFIWLVLLSFCIAAPVAGYFMQQWLAHYAYRTGLSWWIFAEAATGAVAITLMTVSYQTLKAAAANPVKSLRSE